MKSGVSPLYGKDLFGDSAEPPAKGPVAERFGFPPFSVFDARAEDWQERKRAWTALGISGEVGRSAKAVGIQSWLSDPATRGTVWPLEGHTGDGTSIFDPVLCEMVYRWFCPLGGQVVDPFAGGPVRGVVAKALGRRYWGCELRAEQVFANDEQARTIYGAQDDGGLNWLCGDSATSLGSAPEADLIFSCPPYGDLETYSKAPADLSAMGWEDFAVAYAGIICGAVGVLREDRFACFVVGNFRSKEGYLRDLVGLTVSAFEAAGARFYNEAVLSTRVGSAALRVTKQFTLSRKLAKTHQNVLVFCKGDPRQATRAIV